MYLQSSSRKGVSFSATLKPRVETLNEVFHRCEPSYEQFDPNCLITHLCYVGVGPECELPNPWGKAVGRRSQHQLGHFRP